MFIELRTVIERENGEKEMSIIKQSGEYMTKKDVEILRYKEKITDLGEVENFISIRPHKISLKRSGAITMNQQFLPNKKTECLYRHPYGSFYLENFTRSLAHRKLTKEQAGEVIIDYRGTINGEEENNHLLTLTYMEEND